MEEVREISVTGCGILSFPPEIIRLRISIENSCKEYGECIERSAKETAELQEIMGGLGFKPEELKTQNFSVDVEYEGYTDEHNMYRQRFKGYRYAHHMVLSFPADNALLGRMLYALARMEAAPVFTIGYTVKDPEEAKRRLLEAAVADAKEKAELLARAAGVKLLMITRISFPEREPDISIRPLRMAKAMGAMMDAESDESFEINITPEDIRTEEEVTICWKIA